MTEPTARRALNPFVVPGYENVHTRPLCPWTYADHDNYFVGVGNTAEAFATFQRNMSDVAGLRTNGRLVLVTGDPGTGRSALINRCVHWTRQRLHDAGIRAELLDLSDEIPLEKDQQHSIADRMRLVSMHLCTGIDHKLLNASTFESLMERLDEPQMVYPLLSRKLDESLALLVVLPPMISDATEQEVERYARLARAKILLFSECPPLTTKQQGALHALGYRQPTVLDSGKPKPGDATAFVTDRLNRHSSDGVYPMLHEDSLKNLDGAGTSKWTIAMLQAVFCTVYANRLAADPEGYGRNGDKVPADEIEASFLQHFTQRGAN